MPRPRAATARPGLIHRLRAAFLTGLVVVLPAALTVALLVWAIRLVDSYVDPLLPEGSALRDFAGLGVLVVVVLVTAAGALARGYAGGVVLRRIDAVATRLPIVRPLYVGLKQIAETARAKGATSFRQVCLLEYPERGIWTVVAITAPAGGELLTRTGEPDLVGVLVPTAPNPITGFLIFAPRRDLKPLGMSVEDAGKLVLSMGLATPPGYAADEPPSPPAPGRGGAPG